MVITRFFREPSFIYPFTFGTLDIASFFEAVFGFTTVGRRYAPLLSDTTDIAICQYHGRHQPVVTGPYKAIKALDVVAL